MYHVLYFTRRMWLFDRKTTHNRAKNTYTFVKDGTRITLISEKEPLTPPSVQNVSSVLLSQIYFEGPMHELHVIPSSSSLDIGTSSFSPF